MQKLKSNKPLFVSTIYLLVVIFSFAICFVTGRLPVHVIGMIITAPSSLITSALFHKITFNSQFWQLVYVILLPGFFNTIFLYLVSRKIEKDRAQIGELGNNESES